MPSEPQETGRNLVEVTCLVCGRSFNKEIAAAWHEDQTGHDEWSDQEDDGFRADGGAEQREAVHLWVAEYPGNQKDHIVVGDSDELAEHAPAIAVSDVAVVEHLGTFEEFESNRGNYDLDLPKTVAVDGEFTQMVGRQRFWSVLWGDRDE